MSRVTLKPIVLQTWNFRDILFRAWSCAPGYFHPSTFNIDWVMSLDFMKIWNFQLVSHITLKPLVLQTWNFRDIFLCPHHLIGGRIDLPVTVRPSVSPSVCLWKVCVKVERGGICVLWTHVCPIYILICLFCKAVMWDGGISFCDQKLASSFYIWDFYLLDFALTSDIWILHLNDCASTTDN